jgi:hypothetical protein
VLSFNNEDGIGRCFALPTPVDGAAVTARGEAMKDPSAPVYNRAL